MNDSMSILLATTILAVGGLGLYMYKSSDDYKQNGDEDEDEYSKDSNFGGNFWGLSDDKDDDEDEENIDEDLEDNYKPRRKNAKTQRNRKSSGTSRRKY